MILAKILALWLASQPTSMITNHIVQHFLSTTSLEISSPRTTGKHLYADGIFLHRRLLVGAIGIGSELIAQQRGRRRSLAVGVGQAMPTSTVGVDDPQV
jgi:hypothetical protein